MAAEIRVQIADAPLKAALRRLARTMPAGDMTPAMQQLGRVLKTGAQLRFRTGKGPDGTAWKKSLRAATQGGQTLRDQGLLANSITWEASRSSVAVGTNLIYAPIHQFGGTIRASSATTLRFRLATGQWVSPKAVTMPARPFLGASEGDRAELLRVLQAHLEGRWNGG